MNELASLVTDMKDIKTDVVAQIIEQIMRERNGEEIPKEIIANVIQMLIKIDVYKPYFEPELLRISEKFYREESQRLIDPEHIENFDIVGYLKHTDRRVNEEINRCSEYLDKSTENKLVLLIERIFISDNLQTILSHGFDSLVDTKNLECLSKLYYFLEKVGKLDFLKKTWGYYIKQRGTSIMNEAELSVEKILDYKRDLEKILIECFKRNGSLKSAMQFALEDCVNLKTNKIAELTSKHLDEILKHAHKISQEESEVEEKLDDVISIFRFLSAKDIFEAFYNKRLVKRILFGQTSSDDLERRMIEKLKQGNNQFE